MSILTSRPRRTLLVLLAILAVGIITSVSYWRHALSDHGYSFVGAGGDSIVVGIHYSPMSLYRYGDSLGGLNYEIASEIGRIYGCKFKFYPVASSTEALDRLEHGTYDIVIADIPMTASLRERFLFTVPIYTDNLVAVSRDTTLTSPLALAGQTVWAVEGSPAVERLDNLAREIGDTIHVQATSDYTAEQLVLKVAKGDIPLAVVNEDVARQIAADYPALHISTQISLSQFQSWIVGKDSRVLLDSLDSRIERFKLTDAYRTLLLKYSDTPAPDDTLPPVAPQEIN